MRNTINMRSALLLPAAILTAASLILCGGCASTSENLDSQDNDTSRIADSSAKKRSHIDVFAERYLKEMSDFLGSAKTFTFKAESSYDALNRTGHNIRYGGKLSLALQRPNRVRSAFNGDERQTQGFYNGNSFTIYDMRANVYAMTAVPPTIDSAIDMIVEKFGVSLPLTDLLYANPYNILAENIIEGRWVGRHSIAGVLCNHLAFTQESIDWQIWIEDGPQPVPRQVLIIYKDEPGSPQYLARLGSWNFNPKLSKDYFTFTPPENSGEIEFLIRSKEEANNE